MTLKFKKFKTEYSTCWDAELGDGRFFRIHLPNRSYKHTLYLYRGLEDNGITPKNGTMLWYDVKLDRCKQKAQEHADKLTRQQSYVNRYTSRICPDEISLPYKD